MKFQDNTGLCGCLFIVWVVGLISVSVMGFYKLFIYLLHL